MLDVLRPFVIFTKFFSGQNYVTISYVYVFYRYIMNHLDNQEYLSSKSSKLTQQSNSFSLAQLSEYFLDNLKNSVNERLQFILDNEDMFIAATFLDYKYRKFEFCHEGERKKLQKRATEYIP
jgi:hypothetical protein